MLLFQESNFRWVGIHGGGKKLYVHRESSDFNGSIWQDNLRKALGKIVAVIAASIMALYPGTRHKT